MEKHGNEYFGKYIKTKNTILLSITKKSNKVHDEKTKKRIKDILVSIIKKEKENLKKICYEGLPDDLVILRSLIWKINLNYLNMDIDNWEDNMKKKRLEYEDIKSAFMLKLDAERKIYEELDEFEENRKSNLFEFNTARKNLEQELNAYLKHTDRGLLEEIDKDVRRTHTQLNFFFLPSKKDQLTSLTNEEICKIVDKKRSNEVKTTNDIYFNKELNKFETHGDVLSRILYIYAKLNSDISYVQGMNEILAPIYYCFSFDYELFQLNSKYEFDLEADTFWAFTFFMDDLKVLFMKKKDDSKEGIFNKLSILLEILSIVDKDIYNHLVKTGVELTHFAFRWIILLFTQDFILPDVMRLWDAILSEKDRLYCVFYIALSILKIKKEKILSFDFAGVILTLQNLDDLDTEQILYGITKLKKDFDKKIRKILNKKR